jgi:glycerophosphoryl diester phosphodiesterase
MRSSTQTLPQSFVVAHRAGNDLARLRAAEALGVPLVEADVHLFAGRLEVRHRKTVGPIPILWDRWELAPPWAPRMLLEDLLGEASPGTELMLDLKGHDPRLPGRIVTAIGNAGTPRRVTVCSQDWRLLEPLRGVPDVRVVHSVGNARQLARLRRNLTGQPLGGVSIHRRLLDAEVVADLRRRAELVLSWPVESVPQARALAAWGVQGLISQSFERLAPVLAGHVR